MFKLFCVLFLQSDVPTGKNQLGCDFHVPVCVGDVLPDATRLHYLPLRKGHGVAFRGGQAVWGAFMKKTCWMGLGEDNYWQWRAMKWQDESRIIRALNLKWFFFISYLFLFFCVNIFILLWSSNNIWIVTCAECMVGMYSLVGMSICIKRGSTPDPWVFSLCMHSPHSFLLYSLIWVYLKYAKGIDEECFNTSKFLRKSSIKGLIFLNVF